MSTKQKEATSDRSNVKWTDEMRQVLLDNPSIPRSEMVAIFRERFPKFEGSDQSILGARYRLLHAENVRPDLRKKGILARLEAARAEVATLEAELAAFDAGQNGDEESVEQFLQALSEKSHREVQAAAKERGVKASGSTDQILARIREAMTA